MTEGLQGEPVAFVYCADRSRAVAWYRDVLGAPVQSEDEFGVFFRLGPALLRMTQLPGWAPSPHPVLGWNVPDIAGTVRRLRDRGVVFSIYEGMGQDELGVWTSPDGAAKVAWFTDPEGNLLSLSQT